MSNVDKGISLAIQATKEALQAVTERRFFETERGYHGRLYCELQQRLVSRSEIVPSCVLEMEYQKSSRHGLTQRPDIILHVPTEHSGVEPTRNNFVVWALKRRATVIDANEDFRRIEELFESLDYQLGVFINIDSAETMREHYKGKHSSKLMFSSVKLGQCGVRINVEGPEFC